MLLALNPDAVAIPPVIPTLDEFERVLSQIYAEQNRVGILLVEGLLKQTPQAIWNHAEGPKAVITVFRQCLPLCSKFIAALETVPDERAKAVLAVLKATL